MLPIGWRARFAAAVLFLFTIPTTLAFHTFWSADPEAAQNQMIQFLNLAMERLPEAGRAALPSQARSRDRKEKVIAGGG